MSIVSVIRKGAAAAACATLLFTGCGEKNLNPETPQPDEPQKETHFTITVGEIETGAVTYSVKRDNPDKGYYCTIVSDNSLSSLGNDLQSQAKAYMEGEIEFCQDMIGMTLEEAINDVTKTEDIENDYYDGLDAESKYHIVAGYITSDGKVDGEFESFTFTTAPVKPSDNKFEVSYEITSPRSAHVSVTPSNSDPYTIAVLRDDQISGATDEELMQAAIDWYGFMAPSYNDAAEENYALYAGTKYYLIVYGYQSGKSTTAPTLKTFTTPEGGDPKNFGISIAYDDSEARGYKQHVTILPNDDSIDYLYEVVRADYTAEAFTAQYKEDTIKDAEEFGLTLDMYFQMFATHGENVWTYYLTPGLPYKIAAIAVDALKGEFVGDAKFSETFTPEVPGVSKVMAVVDFEKFYDGDAIKAANEEFGMYEGRGVFIPSINSTDENATVYYNVFEYEGPGIYTKDEIIASILEYGTTIKDVCYAPFDSPVAIYAIAVDADGLCSQVYEKVFTLKKDGVSPVEDFFKEYDAMYSSFSAKAKESDKTVARMNGKYLYSKGPKPLR